MKRRWPKATFQKTSLKINFKSKAPKRRHSPNYKTKPQQEDSLKKKVAEGHLPKDKFKDQLQVQSQESMPGSHETIGRHHEQSHETIGRHHENNEIRTRKLLDSTPFVRVTT